MIEIRHLSKHIADKVILEDINLSIHKGEIYGIVGNSGAGKSTLLRCINGLESFDEGSLKVDGTELSTLKDKSLRAFQRKLGMIFQHFSLIERSSVYDNVALPLVCWGYEKKTIQERVEELLNLVGLADRTADLPRQLSGGQKQRVAIARALALQPQILLCDEATSALDPKMTAEILDLLVDINQKLNVTVVIVTHEMAVVKQVCNRMAILSNGRCIEEAEVEEIFLKQPATIASLLGQSSAGLSPTSGHCLELLISGASEEPIMAQMAIETAVPFSIISGALDQYRSGKLGNFVIHVEKEADAEKIKDYLEKEAIQWREA